jgi:hypothetical protein
MLVAKPYLLYQAHKRQVLERKLRGDVEMLDINSY